MDHLTFGGLTISQLRGLDLPETISHCEDSSQRAVLSPDVAWFEQIQRINALQAVIDAMPELLEEIDRLHTSSICNGEPALV